MNQPTAIPGNLLQLGAVRDPSAPTRQVSVFGDTGRAIAHLRDHLLTAPECEAWAVVIPQYSSLLDPTDGKSRFRYCESITESASNGQPLYDLYKAAIVEASDEAAVLHWYCSEGQVTVALGTSGVLILIEGVLKTALLPGQGSAEATRQSHERIVEGFGLPREVGMRSGRPGKWRPVTERETRDRERREESWPHETRLYYRVFRPAVQFIKKCHHHNRNMFGEWRHQDYALLKDILPPRSNLKLEQWQSMRKACGHG